METKTERPGWIEDSHLEYLDDLRGSGETNMYGAGAYLQAQFNLARIEARELLSYWMQTFGKPTR